MILCGGKATRLGELTKETPKGMLLVRGKPVLEHQIEYLKKYGITDIILAVGHLSNKIISYFGDGSKFGVNIKYSFDQSLGTGGALKGCKYILNKTFILMNGDTLFNNLDICNILEVHKDEKMLITVALDESIPVGIYVIDKSLLNLIPDGVCSLEKEIIPLVNINYYFYYEKWVDIGTPESYLKYK